MNTKEVLTEANNMVSAGMRRAAIDLLVEYLESDPCSSSVLGALGRVYLLDHQPEKAVTCLQKSLEISQSRRSGNTGQKTYKSDAFTTDDMDYIDSLDDSDIEDEYSFETERDESLESEDPPEDKQQTLTISVSRNGSKRKKVKPDEDHDGIQVTYRGRKEGVVLTPPVENEQISLPEDQDRSPETDLSEPVENETTDKSELVGNPSPVPVVEPHYDDNEDTHEIRFKEPVRETHREHPESEYSSTLDMFDDIEEVEDDHQDDELLDIEDESIFYGLDEEESDELCWDELDDDLDDYDETAQREDADDILSDGRISREQRARQAAIEVLGRCEWDYSNLPILQEIFYENGWGAARVAIEREIARGATPDEIALARDIRYHWTQNEKYWMSFQAIFKNPRLTETADLYKNMSWPESLRIIRCYPSTPDIEEIKSFIEDAFDSWYLSHHFHRSFRTFLSYIKYLTGSMRRTLPGDCVYSFTEASETESGVDSDDLLNFCSPMSQELIGYGIHLNDWPRIDEKALVIKGLDDVI